MSASANTALMRAQILRELEVRYGEQLRSLKSSLDAARRDLHQEQKKLAVLESTCEQQETNARNREAELRHHYQERIDSLLSKNRKLQELVENDPLSDRARELERQNHELHVRNQHLSAEITDALRGQQAAVLDKEQLSLVHMKALAEERKQSALARQQRESLQSKLTANARHSAALKAQLEATRTRLIALEKERSAVDSSLRSAEEHAARAKDLCVSRVEQTVSDHRKKETVWSQQLTEARERVAQCEEAQQKQAAEFSLEKRELVLAHKQALEAVRKQSDQLRGDVQGVRSRNEKLTQDHAMARREWSSQEQELRAQIAQLEASLRQAGELQHSQSEQAGKQRSAAQQVRNDLTNLQSEMEELEGEYESVREKYRQALERLQVYQSAIDDGYLVPAEAGTRDNAESSERAVGSSSPTPLGGAIGSPSHTASVSYLTQKVRSLSAEVALLKQRLSSASKSAQDSQQQHESVLAEERQMMGVRVRQLQGMLQRMKTDCLSSIGQLKGQVREARKHERRWKQKHTRAATEAQRLQSVVQRQAELCEKLQGEIRELRAGSLRAAESGAAAVSLSFGLPTLRDAPGSASSGGAARPELSEIRDL